MSLTAAISNASDRVESVSLAPARFHIRSLDGLRALAFMIVFVAHAGFGNIVPGGFGVTIFFFLSGFLITSLLRREFLITEGISIKRFYLRRVLRIFPPMYLSLAIMVALTVAGLLPGHLKFWPVVSQSVFLTNYYVLFGSNPASIPHGSGVLWSLAVEEHFYIAFPFFMIITIGALSPKRQAALITVACGIILGWRLFLIVGLHANDMRTYLATDTRIDSILFGCLLGLVFNPAIDRPITFGTWSKLALYVFSVTLLLISFLYRDQSFRATWRYSLQGIALLPLFYFAVVDFDRPWFAWLNWKWVRFFGTLTYTMYLIHLSLILSIQFLVPHLDILVRTALALLLTSAFASAMYYLVERPCAAMRRRLNA